MSKRKQQRYEVELCAVSRHSMVVTVQARDEDEAEQKAKERAWDSKKGDWDHNGFDWESMVVRDVQEVSK